MLMAATGRINVQTVNPFEARKIGAKNLTAEDAGYAEENAGSQKLCVPRVLRVSNPLVARVGSTEISNQRKSVS